MEKMNVLVGKPEPRCGQVNNIKMDHKWNGVE
jgi:hypothetical protein